MNKILDMATISQEDVIKTIKRFSDQQPDPEEMDAVYAFASELTGISVDQLNEWVMKEEKND